MIWGILLHFNKIYCIQNNKSMIFTLKTQMMIKNYATCYMIYVSNNETCQLDNIKGF